MLVLAFTATAIAQLIPEGEYVIRSAQSNDYALTLKDGNASNANTVHFWRWRNDNSQKWKVTHQNGKIVIRSMVNNNYVLDVKGYDYSNNAEVYIYTYHGGNNQLWIPESAINGSYILKTAGDPNYCLNLKNGVAKNDNKVELWQVHKKFQQRWIFEKASKMPKPIQNASSNIADGEYVIKFAKNPDYVLTLKNGNASNANLVHLWKWKNDNSQKWKVTHTNGKIVIRSKVNNNYVLDVTGYAYTDDTQIQIYEYHGADNQLWIPEQLNNGSYALMIAGNPDYCLDLYNGIANNDNKIELWRAHKGFQQQWIFEKTYGSNSNNNNNNTSNPNDIADGVYVIRFTNNPNYVLTLQDSKASNVNLVHLWQWRNDNSQKWRVTHTNGKIAIRSMVDNNYVFDVLDYKYENGTQIIVYTYHGRDNQLWIPERMNNGSYVLKTAGNQNLCLDLLNGNAVNDQKIMLYQAHKGWQQQWTFEKVGN